MAKLWPFLQGHPKPAFSVKVQRGDQGKFFKNRPKSSYRLKGPKAHWRKWYYPLICTHLKCKHWKTFWRKQRLQKCQNGQVMAIFARSFKTRIFWKSAKRTSREIFQKSPKKKLLFERPKSTLPRTSMVLRCNNWRRFWRRKRLQKCLNGEVMAIFPRSPKTRIFWKGEKGGPKVSFSKIAKKVALASKD